MESLEKMNANDDVDDKNENNDNADDISKYDEMPEPLKNIMTYLKTLNDNYHVLADMVNKHSEAIKQIADRLNSQQMAQPAGEQRVNDGSADLMNNLLSAGQMLLQRNQPNPMGEVFNAWLSKMIDSSVANMNSSAELNKSIASAITDAFKTKTATTVAEKLSKVMMSE
ncbi:MAG: hypothetical protein QXL94_03060 [Candidatus Parvarchaeum sp.]